MCASALREQGFSTEEIPFEYSSLPGRWATPVIGFLSIFALALVSREGRQGDAAGALALLVFFLTVLGWCVRWIGTTGVLRLPWGRASSINLVATRGTPRLWLMAHLDSKSQPVPIGLRALGISITLLAWLAASALALLQLGTGRGVQLWPWITTAALLAALPVMASVVGSRSPGALDNASGVAAVLLIAGALAPAISVGVVLTSAEELGLAGARAWGLGQRPGVAINFDGLDDSGPLRLSWSGARPTDLLARIERSAALVGVTARAQRLPPGILTDGVALAGSGWRVVTVSKGGIGTLARIHTRRDRASALAGIGVTEAASMVSRMLAELDP